MLGALEVFLSPRPLKCKRSEPYSIEHEFSALSPSIPRSPCGTRRLQSKTSEVVKYIMSPRRDSVGSKAYAIEEEFGIFSAAQALRELGPGRDEAQLAWDICLLREKLQRFGHVGLIHQALEAHLLDLKSKDPESIADEEVWPSCLVEIGMDPSRFLRPLASDPHFNYALLEKVELHHAHERHALLTTCLAGWTDCIRLPSPAEMR